MALLKDHMDLANVLHTDMNEAIKKDEWPIVVDAGFYAVFQGMEAANALECRDTYSFADAADVLETILVERGFGEEFASDYRFLIYFRRGTIYGAHTPSQAQLAEYVQRVERSFQRLLNYIDASLMQAPFSSDNQPLEAKTAK